MPFKHKLIKELKKCVTAQLQKSTEENKNATGNDSISKQKDKTKHQKLISLKSKNIYQLFFKNMPGPSQHVANFYNILGINEEAIRTQGFEQSYCRTIFYLKNVKKIDIKSNCVVLHLVSSPQLEFPPIQYTIDRYKSFGDMKFYRLANLMEEVGARLKQLEKHDIKSMKEQNSDSFDAYLQSLGNRMFVSKTSSKMALSKSFLQTLEHCPEDFAIETIKFRSSLHQGCSSERYYDVILKTLQNLRNLIDLLFDRISLQTFLDNSLMRFRDILYTKNNKKVIAKVKVGMPTPLVTLFEVEQVLSISDQINMQSYFRASKKQEFTRIRQTLRENDVKTLRNIISLPTGYLPENRKKMAGYVEMNQFSRSLNEPKQ